MKNTAYTNFLNSLPEYTRKIIEEAIKIFFSIVNEEFECDSWLNFNYRSTVLSNDDKVVLSLFLASLAIPGSIKDIFTSDNVTPELVFQYLGVENITLKPLVEGMDEFCFKLYFEKIINKIKSSHDIKENSTLTAEALIYSLSNKFDCNTDIVEWIFQKSNRNAYQSAAFTAIRDKFKQSKKKEEPKTSENVKSSSKMKIKLSGYISEVGTILNNEEYSIDPAIGREEETKDLLISLMTPEVSTILVGPPGTGKTALVERGAYLINKGSVPNILKNKIIVKINISSLVAGTIYRGSFEEKIERILKEAVENKDIIIFLDEMHIAIGAGSASGTNIDLANILKPYLDRGKVNIIGATTTEEYEKFILGDEAFKRRFERIDILEPNESAVAKILQSRISKLEQITGVNFPYDTMDVIKLTNFLAHATSIKNRNSKDNVNNPDLAIKILSKAFVLANYENSSTLKSTYLAESIRRNARLNPASRDRLATELLAMFNTPAITRNRSYHNDIIEFPKR